MNVRNVVLGSALALGFFIGGVTVANAVDPERHPNLAAAQALIDRAYEKISAAEHANEFDMGGHAARAKDLLMQANHEIKEAARAANRNGH
jgi:hypothetical protein